MRTYLAASFDRQEEMKKYARQLKELGGEIVSTWLYEEVFSASSVPTDLASEYAERDVREVKACDFFIWFTESLPANRVLTGGRHVEAGIAIATNKSIFVIGPYENIFTRLSGIAQYNTWDEFYDDLILEINKGRELCQK